MAQVTSFREQMLRDTRGNVMYMTAGLLLPIMATIGAGVDLGQAYMAKSRLQQACDAGVLAGRRLMAEGQFTSEASAAATRMFNFNYQPGQYGATGITFTPTQQGANEVTGTATATVPTIIMRMFGNNSVSLSVNCTAKLEISNADIMFVLDTTGSMNSTNPGDTSSRINALKTEVMGFYDTVADAMNSGSIVRYGVVPYSSNVNVGFLLRDANRSWISDTTELPSRRANFELVQQPDNTTYGTPTQTNSVTGSYSNTSTYYTGYNSRSCSNLAPPSPSNPVSTSAATTTVTGSTVDQYGNTVTTYETRQNFRQTVYRYSYQSSNRRCYRQQATRTYTQVTPYTVTQYAPVNEFRNYTYQAMTYEVGPMVSGTAALVVDNGNNGANVTANWNGCILERDTVDFDSGDFPPADALDLDIDLVPNSDDRTKWKVFLPNIAYPSNWGAWYSQSPDPVTTTDDYDSYAEGGNASGGWAACPTQAMRLRSFANDRATFANYINSLNPVGGTYHDVGMVWGARLISPTGIFAADNATAANGNPISRHIIFMTDGEMSPNAGIYGFQGQEYQMGRVGSTDFNDLRARHNTRFLTACNQAKARNITVWVVSFGVALDANMRACASGDKAFQASNAAQLRQQFQNIASQITRLRLSQ